VSSVYNLTCVVITLALLILNFGDGEVLVVRRGEKSAAGIKKSLWSKPCSILQCFLHGCSFMTVSCHIHVQRFEPIIPFFLIKMTYLEINPNCPFNLINYIQHRLCTEGAGCLSAACSFQTTSEIMSKSTWAFKNSYYVSLSFGAFLPLPTPCIMENGKNHCLFHTPLALLQTK